MLKLKLQYFGHLMKRANSLEKTLMMGKTEGRRCENWTVKKAEQGRIDAFELWCWRRLLRVPWTVREIQPVHPKEDQSWVFIGRTDAEAETPIFWPPHVKS